MEDAGEALTLAPVEPAEPTKRARRARARNGKPKHWPTTPEAESAIRRVLTVLADAREAAGWEPNRLKPTTELCRKRHGALALRLFELAADGPHTYRDKHGKEQQADPEEQLVAVFKAKVEQQRRRDGDHGAGLYAHAKSICSGEWWDSNLAAGRAWLASGGRPVSMAKGVRDVEGGRVNANGSFTPTGKYVAADIFEET